jgi:hypothetical protein
MVEIKREHVSKDEQDMHTEYWPHCEQLFLCCLEECLVCEQSLCLQNFPE